MIKNTEDGCDVIYVWYFNKTNNSNTLKPHKIGEMAI